jgi:glyoxylase-like metal-dependent hydrolase (beta-lactamase superfamily II)
MASLSSAEIQQVFHGLGLQVFERGWLSSNNILFHAHGSTPATVVDTGYAAHAEQTVMLLASALGSETLGCIVNTHLHSDHCGGNAALQSRWSARTLVPRACWEAAASWDEGGLSFRATDQRCDRFAVHGVLRPGDTVQLGRKAWQIHAAPGHDPTALMFFEPESAVLISGDALWERRLAIVFPELSGEPGFEACLKTLDVIERLAPRVVIPGHGCAFSDVTGALLASRNRIRAFQQDPQRHRWHAARALVMFHMLEIGRCQRPSLITWLRQTPITSNLRLGDEDWARAVVHSLEQDGVLRAEAGDLYVV